MEPGGGEADADANFFAPNQSGAAEKVSQQRLLIWLRWMFFAPHRPCGWLLGGGAAVGVGEMLLGSFTYRAAARRLLSPRSTNLLSARGLHMIVTPRSARLVPRELTRASSPPPLARFKEALACVGKCGSVSVQSDADPAWELFLFLFDVFNMQQWCFVHVSSSLHHDDYVSTLITYTITNHATKHVITGCRSTDIFTHDHTLLNQQT